MLLPDTENRLVPGTQESTEKAIHECLRQAVIIFIAAVRSRCGTKTNSMAQRLHTINILLRRCPDSAWKGLELLRYWVLLVVGVEATSEIESLSEIGAERQQWFASRFRACCVEESRTGAEVIKQVQDLVWIKQVSDTPLKGFTSLLSAAEPLSTSRHLHEMQ
jgi:hypothetical protein